ncbi:class I SAM-dependent methyltransferase [Rhodococcus sp. T2V]|uniref:class I SAM-dependent methyltransferase n=1 Tax=Rhodococcus sp. T2V TaxID=3034164 RepID=UPI0034E26FBB
MKDPSQIGAIAPSSNWLSRAITAPVPEHGNPLVVELGAGTGPFTEEIQRRTGGRGRHLAIELNVRLAGLLRKRFTQVEVVESDAINLPAILADRDAGKADIIVSSLPWSVFTSHTQRDIMGAVLRSLSPTGVFTTFAYRHAAPIPGARRFRRLLNEHFEEVVAGRTVWRNLPPAYVLHARRPRTIHPTA